MCLCKFGQNPPTDSGDKSADKKLRGSRHPCFRFQAEKKIGMVGRNNILFCNSFI